MLPALRTSLLPSLLIAVVAIVVQTPDAWSQAAPGYETLPIHPAFVGDGQGAKTTRHNAELFVANAKRNAGSLRSDSERNKFDIYYKQYFFARMTHPEHLGEWAEQRQRLLKELTSPAPAIPQDVHDHLVEVTREMTTKIAEGNFHPVARANAVLLLGELNSREAVLLRQPKRLPEPLIMALAFMLKELNDAQQIDAVKAACLAGILRHVRMDRDLEKMTPPIPRRLVGNNAETQIVDGMVQLLEQDTPPEGRSQSGHDWMRRRAAEILGAFGSLGSGGKAFKVLEDVAADDTAAISVRLAAAEAIGQLKYGQSPPNSAEIAKTLGSVAVTACRKELKRVEDQQLREEEAKLSALPNAGGGSGGVMPDFGGGGAEGMYGGGAEGMYGGDGEGMYGGGGGGDEMYGGGMFGGSDLPGGSKPFDPLGYRVNLTRRRIKSQLLDVKRGLTGPSSKAQEIGGLMAVIQEGADKEYAQKVVDGIALIIDAVDKGNADDMKTLITSVRGAVQDMEDACSIVVDAGDGQSDEGLLSNPLDAMQGLGVPLGEEVPSGPPEAATPPAGKAPAAPAPGKAPATPPAGPPIPDALPAQPPVAPTGPPAAPVKPAPGPPIAPPAANG